MLSLQQEIPGLDGDFIITPVTAWAGHPPRKRPASYCPVCLERVTLKLGRRVRHHYAHPPQSECYAAGGEGALHLSAKLHLADALARFAPLHLQPVCQRVPGEVARTRCPPAPVSALPVTWDEVRVEPSLPSVRSDLLLLNEGVPVLAIEILATHAVDAEKAAKYRSLDIPWIEVRADRIMRETGNWSPAEPIPVGATSTRVEGWRCERHQALYDALLEHEQNGVHRFAWRAVHLYRIDAGRNAGQRRTESLILWMNERREGGRTAEAWLTRDGRDDPLHTPIAVRDREGAMALLHDRFRAWSRWNREARNTVVDSPMSWSEGSPPPPAEQRRLYPERFCYNPHLRTFHAVPGAPAHAWPASLYTHAAVHPVFGHGRCAWSDLPLRDQPALSHFVAAPVWIQQRVHRWEDAGGARMRLDLQLHHHDGSGWETGPSESITLRGQADDALIATGTMQLAETAARLPLEARGDRQEFTAAVRTVFGS